MYKWTQDDADFLRCNGIAVWLSDHHEQLPTESSAQEDAEYEKYLGRYGRDTFDDDDTIDLDQYEQCDGSSCNECDGCEDEEDEEDEWK